MTRKEFAAGWAVLESVFGAQETPRFKAYWTLTEARFPDGAFLVAVRRCAEECPRFPVPKDLLDRMPGRIDKKTAATNAWERALHAAVSGPGTSNGITGWQPSGEDLDPETLAAAGGTRGLKRILAVSEDTEQLGWVRREFLDRWDAVQANVTAGLLPDGTPAPALESGPRDGSTNTRALSDGFGDVEGGANPMPNSLERGSGGRPPSPLGPSQGEGGMRVPHAAGAPQHEDANYCGVNGVKRGANNANDLNG